MATYTATYDNATNVLRVGFGVPAQNDQIVRDAVAAITALGLQGGPIIKVNGPASLPVAVAITHAIAHIFGVVGVYDPKLGKYVVAVSHDPAHQVGDLID